MKAIFESRVESIEKEEVEEVGFEPTARANLSVVVRGRPLRAQNAHRVSTDVRGYMLSFADAAVTTAVKKNFLMRGYDVYDSSF